MSKTKPKKKQKFTHIIVDTGNGDIEFVENNKVAEELKRYYMSVACDQEDVEFFNEEIKVFKISDAVKFELHNIYIEFGGKK